MANFTDLPSEIWHLIAQYILKSQLSELKWLNCFFFNYWMDFKWKRVNVLVDNFDSKTPYRVVRRLVLPFIAPRTRMMSVVLITSALTGTAHDIDFYGGLGCLLDSLTLLPNLTSLSIEHATFHLANFFETITSSSVRNTLRQLSLTGCVEMFASIQKYCTHRSPFDDLTQLTLELYAADGDKDEPSLALEPFLRSLTPTLRSLTILNRSPTLDLSPLFDALSDHDSSVLFSNLTYLSLSLHSNATTPQPLHHFLRNNNHLYHLHLHLFTFLEDEDEELLGAWLATLVNDNLHFPSLQTLNIHLSTSQTGLSALRSLIKLTLPTLSSLILSGHSLKHEMVTELFDAFNECAGLKSLSFRIEKLSVPILELVARKFPQLENLTLSIWAVEKSFHDILRKRRYSLDSPSTQDVFHVWKLRDLKIYQGSNRGVSAIRTVVAGAIPTLANLRG